MSGSKATSEFRKLLDERGVKYGPSGEETLVRLDGKTYRIWAYDNERLAMSIVYLTPEQAIAATLGSDQELIDLAHNAWAMALCAMQGMPIPAEWGDAVEHGLRKYGKNVDEELAGFEEVDDER